MGATSDITTYSDKNKNEDKKGESSLRDPISIQREKRREYDEDGSAYCGIVDGVCALKEGEDGSFVNPMVVNDGSKKVANDILDRTRKYESGRIIYWSTVALTSAQKNLRKKIKEARGKKRKWAQDQKEKAVAKFFKRPRHTCKSCKSVFDSKFVHKASGSYYCPLRTCNACLIETSVLPKSLQQRIEKLTATYVLKTSTREKKRKRVYDENTNPKKKPFKAAVSGVTFGGWGAC